LPSETKANPSQIQSLSENTERPLLTAEKFRAGSWLLLGWCQPQSRRGAAGQFKLATALAPARFLGAAFGIEEGRRAQPPVQCCFGVSLLCCSSSKARAYPGCWLVGWVLLQSALSCCLWHALLKTLRGFLVQRELIPPAQPPEHGS